MGITTEEFVGLLQCVLADKELPDIQENGRLSADVKESLESAEMVGGMALARRHGWMEAQDLSAAGKAISRQTAARILHEFLWRELGEKDIDDISPATVLRDLYDCHACVNHVAQVYCRGLMGASQEGYFGMRECVSKEQAMEIAEKLRTQYKERLCGYQSEEADTISVVADGLDCDEAEAFLHAHPETIHLDVRTAWEYANGHPQGAVNLPLMRLLEQPGKVSENKAAYILLGCDGGYRSEMAARCLSDTGYSRVYHYQFSLQKYKEEKKNGTCIGGAAVDLISSGIHQHSE